MCKNIKALIRLTMFILYMNNKNLIHRAGQRCFELLALIGSPQLL